MEDWPELPEGFYRVPDADVGWHAVAYFTDPDGRLSQQPWARTEDSPDDLFVRTLERSHAKLVEAGCSMLSFDDILRLDAEEGVVLAASMRRNVGLRNGVSERPANRGGHQ